MIKPEQKRSLDPYRNNRFSSEINRFTRIITGGRDSILLPSLSFKLQQHPTSPTTKIVVGPGACIKDDVYIQFTDDYTIDFEDPDFYLDADIDPDDPMNHSGLYYILIDYTYVRSLPPRNAYIRLVKNSQYYLHHADDYIFLGTAEIKHDVINQVYNIVNVYEMDPSLDPPLTREFTYLVPDVIDGGWISP